MIGAYYYRSVYSIKYNIWFNILPVEEYGQNNLGVTVFVDGPTNCGLSVTWKLKKKLILINLKILNILIYSYLHFKVVRNFIRYVYKACRFLLFHFIINFYMVSIFKCMDFWILVLKIYKIVFLVFGFNYHNDFSIPGFKLYMWEMWNVYQIKLKFPIRLYIRYLKYC